MNSPKKNGSIRSGVSPRNSESPRGVNSPRNIISPRTILSPRTVNSSIQKDNPASETSPRIEKQSEEPASASDIDSHKILTIGINAVKIPLLSNIEKAPNSPSGHALSMEKSGVQPETSKTQTTKFLGISPKQLDCTASSPLAREIKILSTLPVEGDEQQPSRINDSVPETPRPIKTGMRRLSMNESCSLSQEIVDCQSNPSASEFTVKNPLYGRSNSTENPRIRKSPTLEDLNLGRASSSLNIESESSSNNSPKAPRGPRVVIIRGTKSSHNESNSSNSS